MARPPALTAIAADVDELQQLCVDDTICVTITLTLLNVALHRDVRLYVYARDANNFSLHHAVCTAPADHEIRAF